MGRKGGKGVQMLGLGSSDLEHGGNPNRPDLERGGRHRFPPGGC